MGRPIERRAEIRSRVPQSGSAAAIEADVLVDDGDRWQVSGRELAVTATPGHTPGHACVDDRERGVLFSGDHVLPTIYSSVGLGGPTITNPIADYLLSLDRIEELGNQTVATGHEVMHRNFVGTSDYPG